MSRDPVYKNWEYEDVEEEDNRELDPITFAKLEEARKMEDMRLAEDRKREEQIRQIEQYYRDDAEKKKRDTDKQ